MKYVLRLLRNLLANHIQRFRFVQIIETSKVGLTDDEIALFKKRVYDIAAITDKTVKVNIMENW